MASTHNLSGESLFASKRSKLSSKPATSRSLSQTRGGVEPSDSPLLKHALAHSANWTLARHGTKWPQLLKAFRRTKDVLEQIYRHEESRSAARTLSADIRKELFPSRILLYSSIVAVAEALRAANYVPQVHESGEMLPRIYLAAKSYLSAVSCEFEEVSLLSYMQALQTSHPLEIAEIWLLSPLLQMCLLVQLSLEIGQVAAEITPGIKVRLEALCASLTRVRQADWPTVFSTLSVSENILATDPAGAYEDMELQSRDSYRHAIQDLARYSQTSEEEIARLAITLAQEAGKSLKRRSGDFVRFTHVGFYLVSAGRKMIEDRIAYRPNGAALVRKILHEAPELYYFLGIEFAVFGIMVFLLSAIQGGIPLIAASLFLLLPCSQAAIETVNQCLRFILPPRLIPQLDFHEGIPKENSTVVAVPALLMSKAQVEHLVRALEVRFLGNMDDNLYFALLTDPPDSATAFDEKDELAALCSGLIDDLNRKHSSKGPDRFFHLHRNRTFNATENTWMGWERKRGKLLDFNELILGGEDKFPVKAGNVSLLRGMKYVITLDADTQLPRGAARRLVGAMAHPLNRAVVDPVTRTVAAGYGVLQPRVGVSVQSVNRSRLAYIYSGQTGLDIYTHAVSDVYQDLFGEAIFTGKGIYEARVFHAVLKDRFPSNAILSHDLIEGGYARTALMSEVELVDDYPSHFSAYNRRKHRWIRGDWQILKWLFSRVKDARGERVKNPLNLLSRWKILDNLRRSVIEAATFIMFLACWFYLPGSPALWTASTIALLLIPAYAQALLTFIRQRKAIHLWGAFLQGLSDFATTQVNILVHLAFLPHQALVTMDAIARTLFRLTVTHQKLLEWETAAQSELDGRRETPVDHYLKLTPILTVLIGIALVMFRPDSLVAALPILALWLFSNPAAKWLDRPIRSTRSLLTSTDQAFLRHAALKTWRFFVQFSTAEEHWLIPDNIQGKDNHVAHRLSTTNLGLLLNSQLAACLLGMQTVPQFAAQATLTMSSVKRLPRFRGQLANWYDTQTLQPLDPPFLSSVDNGNLACCLWTLKEGVAALREQPLFDHSQFQSIVDALDISIEAMKKEAYPPEQLDAVDKIRSEADALLANPTLWCVAAPRFQNALALVIGESSSSSGSDAFWWLGEVRRQLHAVVEMTRSFVPWILPQFESLQKELPHLFTQGCLARITLNSLPSLYTDILEAKDSPTFVTLTEALAHSVRELDELHRNLETLAADADQLVDDMDFGMFYDQGRRVFSVGYTVNESKLLKTSYDLLASEARSALFVGIAKNDLPQEAWLQLGRLHTHYVGRDVLVSWTGTLFEYLMPALWLKHFPNTLVENSLQGAVDCQRLFADAHGIPWGISEGACPPKIEGARYDYQAFGLPQLALSSEVPKRIIITPYASALGFGVQPLAALQNLREMSDRGWMGSFGFYESVEYRGSEASVGERFEIVRAWMAHHQGMILMSICNVLKNSILPALFHQEVRVEAAERLLHELPLSAYGRELARHTPQAAPEAMSA